MHKYFRYIAVRSSRSVDLLLAIFIFICVHLVVYVQISGQHLTKCPFRACKWECCFMVATIRIGLDYVFLFFAGM